MTNTEVKKTKKKNIMIMMTMTMKMMTTMNFYFKINDFYLQWIDIFYNR